MADGRTRSEWRRLLPSTSIKQTWFVPSHIDLVGAEVGNESIWSNRGKRWKDVIKRLNDRFYDFIIMMLSFLRLSHDQAWPRLIRIILYSANIWHERLGKLWIQLKFTQTRLNPESWDRSITVTCTMSVLDVSNSVVEELRVPLQEYVFDTISSSKCEDEWSS